MSKGQGHRFKMFNFDEIDQSLTCWPQPIFCKVLQEFFPFVTRFTSPVYLQTTFLVYCYIHNSSCDAVPSKAALRGYNGYFLLINIDLLFVVIEDIDGREYVGEGTVKQGERTATAAQETVRR